MYNILVQMKIIIQAKANSDISSAHKTTTEWSDYQYL